MKTKLRIAFMGTPEFSVPALNVLIQSGHDVMVVYTQRPKPVGRGHHVHQSAIHRIAEAHGIPVETPPSLKGSEEIHRFSNYQLDLAVVAAYGLILPKAILSVPRLGCLNIHASLLPRWRGAAPIQRAILAGDTETGITLMQMEEGLDTGPMFTRAICPISIKTTAALLHHQLAEEGARLLKDHLHLLEENIKPLATPQPQEGVTYAEKLRKEEGLIEWSRPASEIDRKIRAFNPWPGAYFMRDHEAIKVLSAHLASQESNGTGIILSQDATVSCGEGSLTLEVLQRPGKKSIDGASFLRGLRLGIGAKL